MAKGQTKAATSMSKDLWQQPQDTLNPIWENQQSFGQTGQKEAAAGYEDLATTGGLGPREAGDMVAVAGSDVAGMYDVLEEQARNKIAAQGGIGGGEIAEMAREGAKAQSDAMLRARVAQEQVIAENQLAGLGGLAGMSQNALSNLYNLLALRFGTQDAATRTMQGLASTPGTFGNIMQGIGTIAGAGAPYAKIFGPTAAVAGAGG